MALHSYVVRYDSGFAPNPFYGFCTLSTCKPKIRANAKIGDWIFGSASGSKPTRRSGHLVYAMRVTEALTWDQYAKDSRFLAKKPLRQGSRKQTCGDNIYYRATPQSPWQQRDSFHSRNDGELDPRHVTRDTGVNRILVSDDFIYFGGEGPLIPDKLRDRGGRALCKVGIGHTKFEDLELIDSSIEWLRSLGHFGFSGAPQEWHFLRKIGK